jgi:hypothetical protein
MRVVVAAALVLVAGFAALSAYGALQNLWADYQDSETSTYLVVGVPLLVVSVAALYCAVRLIRRAD